MAAAAEPPRPESAGAAAAQRLLDSEGWEPLGAAPGGERVLSQRSDPNLRGGGGGTKGRARSGKRAALPTLQRREQIAAVGGPLPVGAADSRPSSSLGTARSGGGGSESRGPSRSPSRGSSRGSGRLPPTEAPPGTPPAWVSMGERNEWREGRIEADRQEQERLMSSLWARDFPNEPEEPLADGRRLRMSGQGIGPPPGAEAPAGAGAGAAPPPAGAPSSPDVSVEFGQPMLAAGTAKAVVPRPGTPEATAAAAEGGAPQPVGEAFSPTEPGLSHGGVFPSERPRTAPEMASVAGPPQSRATSAATTTAMRPLTAEGGRSDRQTGELPTAVTAALMLRETAPPDPTGMDPMSGFRLLPTATKPAEVWDDGAPEVGDDGNVTGLVERIGEGRVDVREQTRRNRERSEWEERAERLGKAVRLTTTEVDAASA